MTDFSILALVEAGQVKENDDTSGFIQGLTIEQARSIADWLCLTTGTAVKLQYMSFEGVEHIERTPEQIQAKLQAARERQAPKSS